MRKTIARILRAVANVLDPQRADQDVGLRPSRCRHEECFEVTSFMSKRRVYECLDCGERIQGEPLRR